MLKTLSSRKGPCYGLLNLVFQFPARFLEMHLYMTSALNKSDMKAVGLQMALDLLAKKEKKDSITGLRTRTKPGRPDWKEVGFSSKPHLKTCSHFVAQSRL